MEEALAAVSLFRHLVLRQGVLEVDADLDGVDHLPLGNGWVHVDPLDVQFKLGG